MCTVRYSKTVGVTIRISKHNWRGQQDTQEVEEPEAPQKKMTGYSAVEEQTHTEFPGEEETVATICHHSTICVAEFLSLGWKVGRWWTVPWVARKVCYRQ